MPLVVDEVVISVEFEDGPSPEAPYASGPSASGGPAQFSQNEQSIVSQCVERVLEILAQREER